MFAHFPGVNTLLWPFSSYQPVTECSGGKRRKQSRGPRQPGRTGFSPALGSEDGKEGSKATEVGLTAGPTFLPLYFRAKQSLAIRKPLFKKGKTYVYLQGYTKGGGQVTPTWGPYRKREQPIDWSIRVPEAPSHR